MLPIVMVLITVSVSCMTVWLLMSVFDVESKLLKLKSLECTEAARNHFLLLSTVLDVKRTACTVLWAWVQNLLMVIAVFRAFLLC